jgi:hypothetical protein
VKQSRRAPPTLGKALVMNAVSFKNEIMCISEAFSRRNNLNAARTSPLNK